MNSFFDILWIICQVIFWVAAIMGAAILGFVIVVTLWNEAKKAVKRGKPPVQYPQLMNRAVAESRNRSEDGFYQNAFIDGAQWWYLQDK